MKRLMNAKEVAHVLGLAPGSIYNLASAGKLPVVRVFGALRFDPDDVERLVNEGRGPARPAPVGQDEARTIRSTD